MVQRQTGPAPAVGSARARTQAGAAHVVYVALGGNDFAVSDPPEVVVAQTYPALLARHLPRGSRFLNIGTQGESVGYVALTDLSRALAAHPTLVTVWVGWNDLYDATDASHYRGYLDQLLSAFQRQHARVFIGNMPDLSIVPISYGGGQQYIKAALAYNAIIAAAAAQYGATVVNVFANTSLFWPHPELQTPYNSELIRQGHVVLAQIFYRVMHKAGAL